MFKLVLILSWTFYLVVKALDPKARGLEFKTAGCLLGQLILSFYRGRFKWIPGTPVDRVVKSKLSPCIGSVALRGKSFFFVIFHCLLINIRSSPSVFILDVEPLLLGNFCLDRVKRCMFISCQIGLGWSGIISGEFYWPALFLRWFSGCRSSHWVSGLSFIQSRHIRFWRRQIVEIG